KTLIPVIIGVVVVLCGLVVFDTRPTSHLTIQNQAVNIETVSSPESITRGLSGRDQLSENHGMLFVMGRNDRHCFWMKDMKFPLDIIWLDNQKRIVHIEANVAPESFPKSFCPNEPAHYVLEVNAGSAADWGWSVGQQATF